MGAERQAIRKSDFRRLGKYLWELPREFDRRMRVPVHVYADEELLEDALQDESIQQAVNVASLPGLVGRVAVMPDAHQGYGMPVGGVMASQVPGGIISPGAIGYDINCLAGDAEVLHPFGYRVPIGAAEARWRQEELLCLDASAKRLVATRPVLWFGTRPGAPLLKVRTELGGRVTATADHPFLTPRGMRPLRELRPGDLVARYHFSGVPYEAPPAETIITEEQVAAVLERFGRSDRGNALSQVVHFLRRRGLVPLRFDSPALPYLLRLLGHVFGDGHVGFLSSTGNGVVSLYAKAEDLEPIRADLAALGFRSGRVYRRRRRHRVRSAYREYFFEREETWLRVSSTSLAALLAALGAPVGEKACQDFTAPALLDRAPLWQRRLFLAALFGAELSGPRAVTGHGRNLGAPTLSVNKRAKWAESGEAFLRQIERWLGDFGVAVQGISRRTEQVNADGEPSIWLRLTVSAEPENLLRLWSTVGYEYNRTRQARAAVAAAYLRAKLTHLQAHKAQRSALALAAGGMSLAAIEAGLVTFAKFERATTSSLEGSGLVWERVVEVKPAEETPEVFDFTVAHRDHNFVANGFVVSNCGVRLLASDVTREQVAPVLDRLADAIDRNCPSGVGSEGHFPLSDRQLEDVMREGARWAAKRGLAEPEDLERTEEGGCIAGADPAKVSVRARERGRDQLGTVGAGNHFVELDVVEAVYDERAAERMGLFPGQAVALIHCGSRGIGHQICTDYLQRFERIIRQYGIGLPDRELMCAPLDSPEGQDYLKAMAAAANFAFCNRQVLAHQVRRSFAEALAPLGLKPRLWQVYDLAHNMGKTETHEVDGRRCKVCVHRKGATRAWGPGSPGLPAAYRDLGQPVLIPGSMGTASYVLVGTEQAMAMTFGSTCHGAGRVMSRARAKREIRGERLKAELEGRGIAVRAGSLPGLAEEAPVAYKDVDRVVQTVHEAGIARKVARLRPLAVIKG